MSKNIEQDILSWELFYDYSKKINSTPKKVKLYNRLICHTENFFAIAGYGSFTKGYIIIITKKLLPSFANVDSECKNELDWFVNLIGNLQKEIYDKRSIHFEHGMCACVGGLDRAHCHFMTVNKKTDENQIINAINKVLKNRNAGITSINFSNVKLTNRDDIDQIIKITDKKKYKQEGYQFKLPDIQNIDVAKWPYVARKYVNSGGHYVYFNTGKAHSSFLTNKNFQTQLGREIIFEIETKLNKYLRKKNKILKKNNPYANLWKWQEYLFEKNILNTLSKTRQYFRSKKIENSIKYNFRYL